MIKKQSMYYDYGPILSRNAFINIVCGGRGLGKTFGAKRLMMNDYFRNGWQFIYLRRFATDLKASAPTFFADIAHEYPDYEFRVHGREAQCKPADDDDAPWQTMGWFVALSSGTTKKSVAYPMVKWVVYDEFLLPKGLVRYLPDELTAFLEMYNTIDRNQDRVKVLLIANNVDIANPYFLEWGIRPELGKIRRYKDGLVAVDFPRGTEYAAHARRSNLGKLTEGTAYARYAIDNEPITGASAYVRKKPGSATYAFTIEHGKARLSFWANMSDFTWHVSSRDVSEPLVHHLTVRDNNDGGTVLAPNDDVVKMLVTAYRHRKLWFDSDQIHASFQEILAFLNTK